MSNPSSAAHTNQMLRVAGCGLRVTGCALWRPRGGRLGHRPGRACILYIGVVYDHTWTHTHEMTRVTGLMAGCEGKCAVAPSGPGGTLCTLYIEEKNSFAG